jgi:hypothetical protein
MLFVSREEEARRRQQQALQELRTQNDLMRREQARKLAEAGKAAEAEQKRLAQQQQVVANQMQYAAMMQNIKAEKMLEIERERERRNKVAPARMVLDHWPHELEPGEVVTVGQVEDWIEFERELRKQAERDAEDARRAAPATEFDYLWAGLPFPQEGPYLSTGEAEKEIAARYDERFSAAPLRDEVTAQTKVLDGIRYWLTFAWVAVPLSFLMGGFLGWWALLGVSVLLLCFTVWHDQDGGYGYIKLYPSGARRDLFLPFPPAGDLFTSFPLIGPMAALVKLAPFYAFVLLGGAAILATLNSIRRWPVETKRYHDVLDEQDRKVRERDERWARINYDVYSFCARTGLLPENAVHPLLRSFRMRSAADGLGYGVSEWPY